MAKRSNNPAKPTMARASMPEIGLRVKRDIIANRVSIAAKTIKPLVRFFITHLLFCFSQDLLVRKRSFDKQIELLCQVNCPRLI